MKKQAILATGYSQPAAAYSQAILTEGRATLYISGQGPVDKDGHLVGKGDLAAQSRQCFENIKAHLAVAGADFSNVVKFTIFIADDMANFAEFSSVRNEYIEPDFPAASAIGVTSLVNPDWLVEIEAIAVID